jgi:hypothetical protein
LLIERWSLGAEGFSFLFFFWHTRIVYSACIPTKVPRRNWGGGFLLVFFELGLADWRRGITVFGRRGLMLMIIELVDGDWGYLLTLNPVGLERRRFFTLQTIIMIFLSKQHPSNTARGSRIRRLLAYIGAIRFNPRFLFV